MNDLTHEELVNAIRYEPDTGNFWWKIKTSPSANMKKPIGFRMSAKAHKNHRYIIIHFKKKRWRAHRLAWFYVHRMWPSGLIDHINGDCSDNRIENLRDVTNAQNMMNSNGQSQSCSGVKGVSWERRRKKWRSTIKVGGRKKHLGYFESVSDARNAYERAAENDFGQFALHISNPCSNSS